MMTIFMISIMTRARTILTMMIWVMLIVILMFMALWNRMIMSCIMIFMGRMTVGCIVWLRVMLVECPNSRCNASLLDRCGGM